MIWPIQGWRRKKPGGKLIIAEWSYQGDIGQGGLLLPSNTRFGLMRALQAAEKDGFGRNEWKAYLSG